MNLRSLFLLAALLIVAPWSHAQNGQNFPPDNGPYSSGQLYLLPQNAVPMIQQATVAPTTAIGSTQYFYWIVTHDVTNGRFSIPAGPFITSIGPAALSATASIKVTWLNYTLPLTYGQSSASQTPFTATVVNYDVLETATGTPPSGACNCAVVIGAGGASATDTGSYSLYTVNVPTWPGNYPTSGNIAGFGPKGSVIDSGTVIPPATPNVVQLTTTFQDAQNALPSTGGASGIGGGVIDARNCTQLPSSALDFGTFTQTKPLTILLGPCLYTFKQILLGNPGGNTISFHMVGCGFICTALLGTSTTVGQTLITSATNNQTQYDVLFQDMGVFNSGTAGQDVFGFTPTSSNSLNGFVFQRLFIGFGSLSGGVTGSAIKIDASALGHGNIERILIDDNHIELAGGLSAPAISLIGAIGKETRILQNNFETGSATPSGVGISLTSASATAFPANVVIQSNTFDDAFLTTLEADGAVGVVFNGNIVMGTFGGTRNGIQMQVGTGTVHSSLDASDNVFNINGTLAYALKTTDASATASFSNNLIIGTPTTVFSGFTVGNLAVTGNKGTGLVTGGFGAAGTNHNGGLVPDPGASAHSPAFYLGDDNAFHDVLANAPPVQAYSVTTQSVDVALTGSVAAVTITHAVTMPSSGCPCRVLANWGQYMTTTGSVVVAEEWVRDGSVNFAEAEWPIDTNNGPSGTGSGMSPNTYANNAVVTFTLNVEVDGSSVTARAAPFHAFGLRNSRLELTVIPSN